MPHLMIVHRSTDGNEVIINADQVIWAERLPSSEGEFTSVKFAEGGLTIMETLEELMTALNSMI